MKKILFSLICGLSLLAFLNTTYASRNPNPSEFSAWTGTPIKFYVTNNTDKTLKLGPAWSGMQVNLDFPQGSTIASGSTIHYLVNALTVDKFMMGELDTGIFLGDTLTEVCDSHILVGENTNSTFGLSDYERDGLYVATKSSQFNCSGEPINFSDGSLHLIVNSN